jgi:acetylornithine/N-succinyldiaminopimelate aminotransferase
VLATEQAAQGMVAGSHGSTFGGNPLATAVGNAVLDVVLENGFLDNVQRQSINLKQKLERLKDTHPDVIEDVRGQGLMMGLKVKPLNAEFVKAALDQKLLVLAAGDNVVRLLPPLIVNENDIAEAVSKLEAACVALEKKN